MFIAGLFGQKTVMQAAASAYDTYGSSASGAAAAAEKANKTLAGFDTLNVLSSSKASGSGSGSGSSGSGATTQWVETAVVGSEWSSGIMTALDKVKPQFQAFYDEVLSPFKEWTMSEGLPGLITFLGNVAQFFADHPYLTDNLVGFVAAMVGLSSLGALTPTTAAITVTVFASIGAVEWATGKDFNKALQAILDNMSGKTQVPFNVWDYLQWANDPRKLLEAFNGSLFGTLAEMQLTINLALARLGKQMQLGLYQNIVNPFIIGLDYMVGKINAILGALGIPQISVDLKPIDTTGLDRDVSNISQEIYELTTKTGRYADLSTTKIKDSFGGMPSSVQNYMNQTNNVVTAASAAGSNQLKTSWGSGVQGVKDSFGGMPSSVQNYMNGLNNNITTATDAGMGALTGKTAAGTGTAKELYRNTVNSTSTYLEGLANNTNTALSSAFKTLNGMPSAVQKIMGINWSTFQATGSVSLPRFANGAFLRANQPQLAIVGDNRYEGEFVAPESKLVQAVTSGVQAALRALTPAQTAYSGAGGGDTNIYIGGRQITDYVVERTKRTNRLKGE